jgi:16S rRNA processing protein RimM
LSSKEQFVVVARIIRPRGRRGEVLADILTDFPDRFAERRQLWLGAEDSPDRREYTLENHWLHKGRIVFKFAGVDSITDAEALSRKIVSIPLESRAELEANSFYVSALVGSTVRDVAPRTARSIGMIQDVRRIAGIAPTLIVQNESHEYEIPLAQEYIVAFNGDAKILDMKLPEGLLEVNAPITAEEKKQQD